jgi:transposase-like protein
LTRTDYNTEQFAGFQANWEESFWGDLRSQARQTLKTFLEVDAEQQMEQYLGLRWYERPAAGEVRPDSRNGFYERDYVTPLGIIRLRVPRTRRRSFLPRWLKRLERRSPEVAELIRQAFLRGVSTRQVGRVVALLSDEPVSAQTVSKLTRVLDAQVRAFHEAELGDEWAYLFLDGVWIKVRRSFGPQRVLLLVAYGVRPNGERQLIGFGRARGESQAAGEGALQSFFRRGLLGRHLQLIITDGGAGLAAALQTVYPGVPHQRCWVHKMRNITDAVRRRDHDRVKQDARKIYLAPSLAEARQAFRNLQRTWQSSYPRVVRSLEKDLPDLLNFYAFPQHRWKKLRTTNAIERCFVEVRRRTRPMVVFTNVQSVDRIIYAIFHRFNEDWRNRTLELFTQRT